MKYLPWALAGICLLVSAYFWYEMSDKANESRQFEAKMLEAQGIAVQQEVTLRKLETDHKEALAHSESLQAELERVKKAQPQVKIVEVQIATSGPVESKEPIKTSDKLELRISELKLQTEAGNHVLIGSVQLYRLEPPPETLLIDSPLKYNIGDKLAASEVHAGWPTWALFASAGLGAAAVIALEIALKR